MHPQTLEPYRLLEGVADAQIGPLGDGHVGDVHAVQQNLAAGGLVDARNDLGQRGLAAAVGAGDGNEAILHGQADVMQDLLVIVGLKTDVFQFKHIFLRKNRFIAYSTTFYRI